MKEIFLPYSTSNAYSVLFAQWLSSGVFLYALTQNYSLHFWILSFFIYFCTGCLGITVTFHRYLSHKSFIMPKPLLYLFSIFGALGGTGSPFAWVALHRTHHKYSDTDMDPHSPHNGTKNVFFNKYNFVFNKWIVRDLLTDSFQKVLHHYYNLLLLIWGLFWLAVSIDLFIFVFAVPVFMQIWVSIASNIFNHSSGYQNFKTNDSSTNNAFIAFISWGEGWHNNHHKFPSRWSFQVKWWELDTSGYIISIIMFFSSRTKSNKTISS